MDKLPATSASVHRAIANFTYPAFGYDARQYHERAERVGATLQTFAGDFLNPLAIDAAAKQELTNHVLHETPYAPHAARTTLDYWVEGLADHGNIRYDASLSYDFKRIDQTAGNYLSRLAETPEGIVLLDSLDRSDDLPILDKYWREGKSGVNVPEIAQLVSEVNVESVLGRAALVLDNIIHLDAHPREQLKNILEAETTYAPILDIFGLSANEMAVRSETSKARLIAGGAGELVDLARSKIEEVHRVNGQQAILQSLFDHVPAETTYHVPDKSPYGETIHFSEYDLALLTEDRWQGRVIIRTKTVGSLADKMANNPAYTKQLPQDIIGMTIIVEDRTQQAEVLEYLITKMNHSPDLTPVVAASKEKPAFIQGRPEFIGALESAIDPELFRSIQTKSIDEPEDEVFRVAKVTFDGHADGIRIPTEIQVHTDDDRRHARFVNPHFLTKDRARLEGLPGVIPGDRRSLETMNGRRAALLEGNRMNIIPITGTSGWEFSQAVLRLAGVAKLSLD